MARRIDRRMALAVLVVLHLLGLAAVAAWRMRGRVPAERVRTFTFVNGAEPQTLDPLRMTGVPESTVARELFEGLTRLDPETLQPVPGMAKSWDVSADGLTYTFHLREAHWSNGDRVTAGDFLYSWERVLNPETVGSLYAYQLFYVKGARAYSKGESADFGTVAVRAPDDGTLVVTLEQPTAYFLELTAFATLFPVHRATVEAHGDRWTRPGNIVTNGAFLLDSWKPQQELVLKRNPAYWDAARVGLERVRVLPTEKSEIGYMMYLNGEVDWIRSIPLAHTDAAKKRRDYHSAPYFGTYFYRMNVTRPPLDAVRVRKALALSVDREAITSYVLKAGQQPAATFVPPMISGYESAPGFSYDPDAARKLLAEAGYPGGKGMRELAVLYNTSEAHKKIAEVVQQMWKKELGIEVVLANQEWKVYLSTVNSLDYDVARGTWIGDYLDPNTFLDMFVTGGGNNRTGWSSDRYDELIARAAREPDIGSRARMLREAEGILTYDELPFFPIYFYVYEYLLRPGVGGFFENPLNIHPLRAVRWEDQGVGDL